MDKETKQNRGSANTILVVLLVVAAFLIGSLWTRVQTLDKNTITGNTQAPQVTGTAANNPPQAQPTIPPGPNTVSVKAKGVTTFKEKKDAKICEENGKPNIYLFSTTWCPHCTWIKETFDKVVKEYVDDGKINAYHWEVDINDNVLTNAKETKVPAEDMAVYQEFNPGGSIPTFVFGCKYFRTGNGYEQQDDLASEEKEFKAVIDDLLK